MSIKDIVLKIKRQGRGEGRMLPDISDDFFLAFLFIFATLGAFGLGRISALEGERTPVRIEYADGTSAPLTASASPQGQSQGANTINAIAPSTQSSGQLVGSKSGNKYHYPWCSGAQRIKEENKVFFASKQEAEAKGYTPAANCKGL